MPRESAPPQVDMMGRSEFIRALDRLFTSADVEELQHALAEALLAVGGASVVEIALGVESDKRLVSGYVLHADGAHAPFFPDIGSASLAVAAVRDAKPQMGSLAALGTDGSVTHVLVYPIVDASGSNEEPRPPVGVVALGYVTSPSLPSWLDRALRVLTSHFANRLGHLLFKRERARQKVHMALLNEISALVVHDGSGEQLFNTAIRRMQEVFDLDVVAVYAGSPLTLRLLRGGRAVQLGTPVPKEVGARVVEHARAVAYDLSGNGAGSLPPWVPQTATTEVVIPLTYCERRIGVLDLYSARAAASDEMALQALSILARQLALLIVQGRWGKQETEAEQRVPSSQLPLGSGDGLDSRTDDSDHLDSRELQLAYHRLQEFAELKDQILQNISHELRTPLTLIKGYLELMMDGQMGELLPDQREGLQMVLLKVDDVTRIVEQIVSLSPLSRLSVAYQRISVADLFAELALVFVQRTTGSGISWNIPPVASDLYLSGDRDQIRQVLYNILDNSVKFSPKGGRITVQAVSELANVHVIVQDQGVGIPKPRLSQIFETFYQVDGSSTRRFGGLGLGLAVVNRVVKAHNGKVWAESELGKGSIFHVLLPKYISPNQVFDPAVAGAL